MLALSHRARLSVWLVVGAVSLRCGSVEAADAPAVLSLTPSETAAVARAFAPILVFHPRERYLPTSSMIPPGGDPASLLRKAWSNAQGAGSPGLATWPQRVAEYRALSLPEKLQRAALGYRVFSRIEQGHVEVVVEYLVLLRVQRIHGAGHLAPVSRTRTTTRTNLEAFVLGVDADRGCGFHSRCNRRDLGPRRISHSTCGGQCPRRKHSSKSVRRPRWRGARTPTDDFGRTRLARDGAGHQ